MRTPVRHHERGSRTLVRPAPPPPPLIMISKGPYVRLTWPGTNGSADVILDDWQCVHGDPPVLTWSDDFNRADGDPDDPPDHPWANCPFQATRVQIVSQELNCPMNDADNDAWWNGGYPLQPARMSAEVDAANIGYDAHMLSAIGWELGLWEAGIAVPSHYGRLWLQGVDNIPYHERKIEAKSPAGTANSGWIETTPADTLGKRLSVTVWKNGTTVDFDGMSVTA